MDDLDRASELEEKQRAQAMTRRKDTPKPTGFCLQCGIETKPNQCFCDPDCRDDFEVAQAARIRNGAGDRR